MIALSKWDSKATITFQTAKLNNFEKTVIEIEHTCQVISKVNLINFEERIHLILLPCDPCEVGLIKSTLQTLRQHAPRDHI